MTYTTHTHNLCRRTRTTQARRYASDTVVAEEAGKTAREGRPAGWGGGWGGGAGGVAGQVVGGGWIFGVKNVLE